MEIKKEFNASITIQSSYEDDIKIVVRDSDASRAFIEIHLTREQFINATMNRLGETDCKSAVAYNIDKLGKKMITKPFEFPIEENWKREDIISHVKDLYKDTEWLPDTSFSSRRSIFYDSKNRKHARTILRTWVNQEVLP